MTPEEEAVAVLNAPSRLARFAKYRAVLERSDGLSGQALTRALTFNARFVTAIRLEAERRDLLAPWVVDRA